MLGRGLFDLNEDPFFQSHRQAMLGGGGGGGLFPSMMDPFAFPGPSPLLARPLLSAPPSRALGGGAAAVGVGGQLALREDPFLAMGNPFAQMNRMMQDMQRSMTMGMDMGGGGGGGLMRELEQGGAGGGGGVGHSYSYSSVMTFSSGGGGGGGPGQQQPQVFQASCSTRHAPGGIKETRKTLRDSHSGLNKMSIGHHINDRGHVIERSMNSRTKEKDEKQEFINMDEEEAEAFNEEWTEATSKHGRVAATHAQGGVQGPHQPQARLKSAPPSNAPLALPSSSHGSRGQAHSHSHPQQQPNHAHFSRRRPADNSYRHRQPLDANTTRRFREMDSGTSASGPHKASHYNRHKGPKAPKYDY